MRSRLSGLKLNGKFTIVDVRNGVDGSYFITNVEHNYSGQQGYTTTINFVNDLAMLLVPPGIGRSRASRCRGQIIEARVDGAAAHILDGT